MTFGEALSAPVPVWVVVLMAGLWLLAVVLLRWRFQDVCNALMSRLSHLEEEQRLQRGRIEGLDHRVNGQRENIDDCRTLIGNLQRFTHLDDANEGRRGLESRALKVIEQALRRCPPPDGKTPPPARGPREGRLL